MGRISYTVEIPDTAYWKRQIKCQYACPVHTDARGYIKNISRSEYEKGYLKARAANPLASICGRICGAPCESACRRGSLDRPVAIRALKRFLTEQHGPEVFRGSAPAFFNSILKRTESLDCTDAEALPVYQEIFAAKPLRDKKISIVGSGPAGLAAAHDLALMGARVTLFEMEGELGGMLALGVPNYRLKRETIRAETEIIRGLGVKTITNTQLGTDLTLEELRTTSDAIVIAVGAKHSRRIPIPGSDAEGLLGGIEFLRESALENPVSLGQKVVVVGGGNVAYDVARTVLRQVESDISRVALRQPFVKEVHLCCLESLEEMPADDVEILEGAEEGITRHNSLGPKEILKHNGRVSGVVFKECLSVYDEEGRFAPVFDEDELVTLEADSVIMSVGQAMDLSFLESGSDVKLTDRGLIDVSQDQMTTAAGIFVAGDVAHGTKLLIDAVASGKEVARSIFRYLTGKNLNLETTVSHIPMMEWDRERDYEQLPRTPVPNSSIESRVQSVSADVELGYDSALAQQESSRCLDCGVNTIFDGEKCILCGGCADVCPELCLKLVPASSIQGENLEAVMQAHLDGCSLNEASAIIKDEERCIRCGLCAQRCPTGAISMEQFSFKEVWHVS